VAFADLASNVLFVDENSNVFCERVTRDLVDIEMVSCERMKTLAFAEPSCVTLVRLEEAQRRVEQLGGHEGRVTGLALFHTQGNLTWVVSADERGNVLRWNATAVTSPASQRIHRKAVSKLLATRLADGRDAFLTTSDDRQVVICDVTSGEVLIRLAAHAGWVEQIVPLSQAGYLWGIAVVDRIGLTIWDAKTGLAIGRVFGKSTADVATFWHPSCGTLVVFTTLDTVALWSLNGLTFIPQPTRDVVRASAVTIDAIGRISILAGVGDTILISKPGGLFEQTRIRFPAAILRWYPWSSGTGVIIVLEDWSIWNTVVNDAK
jgi:hypothetical protein